MSKKEMVRVKNRAEGMEKRLQMINLVEMGGKRRERALERSCCLSGRLGTVLPSLR